MLLLGLRTQQNADRFIELYSLLFRKSLGDGLARPICGEDVVWKQPGGAGTRRCCPQVEGQPRPTQTLPATNSQHSKYGHCKWQGCTGQNAQTITISRTI